MVYKVTSAKIALASEDNFCRGLEGESLQTTPYFQQE